MRTWVADLTGLMIGFAIGGAALVHYLPTLEQWRQGSAATQNSAASAAPVPHTATPPPPQVIAAAPSRPVLLPDIGAAAPARAPLPVVVDADEPDAPTPPAKPGTLMAGTGFFLADGLLMTAAHVVPQCRRTEIISPFIPRTAVRVLARDARKDVALLRAPGLTAPASLALGKPSAADDKVFVLGYPATAGLRDPEETWGTLENDKFAPVPGSTGDPREIVWLHAAAVTHGYSGGPIFDPRTGKVVGIVRAGVLMTRRSADRGMPSSGMSVGPGFGRLNTFLESEAPGTPDFPADQWGEDPITVVRHATVHVFCLN